MDEWIEIKVKNYKDRESIILALVNSGYTVYTVAKREYPKGNEYYIKFKLN